jgi:hypothetical protein
MLLYNYGNALIYLYLDLQSEYNQLSLHLFFDPSLATDTSAHGYLPQGPSERSAEVFFGAMICKLGLYMQTHIYGANQGNLAGGNGLPNWYLLRLSGSMHLMSCDWIGSMCDKPSLYIYAHY